MCKAAKATPEQQHQDIALHKRSLLLGVAGFVAGTWLQQFVSPAQAVTGRAAAVPVLGDLAAAADLVPAVLDLERTPDQSKYDPAVSEHHQGLYASSICVATRVHQLLVLTHFSFT